MSKTATELIKKRNYLISIDSNQNLKSYHDAPLIYLFIPAYSNAQNTD